MIVVYIRDTGVLIFSLSCMAVVVNKFFRVNKCHRPRALCVSRHVAPRGARDCGVFSCAQLAAVATAATCGGRAADVFYAHAAPATSTMFVRPIRNQVSSGLARER